MVNRLRLNTVESREGKKKMEREEHNRTYDELAGAQLHLTSPKDYVREIATPAHLDNSALNGIINGRFLDRVQFELERRSSSELNILDYGCGMGKLSVYLAQQGYGPIEGFDLSDSGVVFGNELATKNGVGDIVRLEQMDAEALTYGDETFDVVVGKAVLHHTIKYPDSAAELLRILRPDGVAIFKENLGNNPLLKLARFVTMGLLGHHGDVNITSRMLREYGAGFKSLEIDACSCFAMAKRLLWSPGEQTMGRKRLMRWLWQLDEMTVHKSLRAREALCGEAILVFTK